MKKWLTGLLILACGFFTAAIPSKDQDVGVCGRERISEPAPCDAIAPPYTSGLGSWSDWRGASGKRFSEIITSPKPLNVARGIRLIVFSPHPDDETLGAGGLIQRVVQNEGTVRVVFMTNGDGYKEAIRNRVHSVSVSPRDFVEYGKLRQEESDHALCELGLTPQDGIFLGFPDDGIDDLWSRYWSSLNPYTSPHTLADGPPYEQAFNRQVKYAGMDLEGAIVWILKEFVPDWIVIPDPRDQHPDHACTSVFVLDALRRLDQSGELSFHQSCVFTYLVHYVGYPTSQRWLRTIHKAGIGGSLASVDVLSATPWLALTLTGEELRRKRCALAAHQSQFEILGGFFEQYVRSTEVFGQLDPTQVFAVPQEYAARFNRPNS